ncbi:hypothetical protein XENTR_v10004403 [Xenopus tropicalis]|nr:hypothetical protein XENTR_v10004403 [Xenopus tropicalis]
MRPRWLRAVGITIGALTVCSLFYGHYYSSLVSVARSPQGGVGYDFPSKGLEWIPAVPHGRERNRELAETLRVQRPSKVPGTCPTSLQLRVKNDSYFKTIFNFEVPLLLWNSHLTENNWDTLSKRPVPYGWKDLPREDVASALKLLNDSANKAMFERQGPQKCIRCAVVGNGGILNGSKKGKEIDGHDYVFRLNGAVIKGFEKDVGTKTSFYGFTVNTMKNSLISYQEHGFTETPKGKVSTYITN